VVRRNPFDLEGRGVRLAPAPGGGYQADPFEPAPLPPAGEITVAPDGEAHVLALPFAFSFFGRTYDRAFVHPDGLVTFEAPPAAGGHGLPAFLAGPPALAAFFADLDLHRGGTLTLRASAAQVDIVWTDVPGAAQINANRFAVSLFPDGRIDLAFVRLETREGVVGVTPGGAADAVPADLSGPASATGALAELFSESERLDLVATTRRFYRDHPDDFDQLIVYTTRPLNPVPGSFAFEILVRNDVRGIGAGVVDDGESWGSAARLSSVVFMDSMETYRERDGFEILGHEVGHRWLATLRFRDARGGASTRLLAGDLIHWSFFFDSGTSPLGGNQIAETSPGHFETIDFARRYGPLDQYAMGLRAPEEVPPLFFVEEADQFRPNQTFKPSSSPQAGVQFIGRRVTVAIEDVIAAMGPRVPHAADSPRVWRQAYLLVGDDTAPPNDDRRAVVARIRSRFEGWFREATEGRAAADTRLFE
jgi:hypothetical protein